jgi:hypothetical protein
MVLILLSSSSLKMQWGERPDYENVPKEQKQFMRVEPS